MLASWIQIRVSDGPSVSLSTTPVPAGAALESSPPTEFWICPPEQPPVFALVQVPPLPVTVRLPEEPVVSSRMPSGAPLEEIDWNFSPPAPIVTCSTSSALPVVDVNVLPLAVAVTVPPFVARKAAPPPLEIVSVPVKLIVVPPFDCSEIALPLIAPLRATVPPVRPEIDTAAPVDPLIDAPRRTLPLPPVSEKPAVPLPVMLPGAAWLMNTFVMFPVPAMPAALALTTSMPAIVSWSAKSMPSPAALVICGFAPEAGTSTSARFWSPSDWPCRSSVGSSVDPPGRAVVRP